MLNSEFNSFTLAIYAYLISLKKILLQGKNVTCASAAFLYKIVLLRDPSVSKSHWVERKHCFVLMTCWYVDYVSVHKFIYHRCKSCLCQITCVCRPVLSRDEHVHILRSSRSNDNNGMTCTHTVGNGH